MFQHKVNGRGGQIPIQAAISELPEWLQSALYRGAAKGGLTETDPLWGCLVANGELLKSYLDAQADGTKKSVEELTQAIRELSRSVKHRVEPESRPENIAKLWAAILIAVVAVFGVGYFACWSRTHLALEARMQEASQARHKRTASSQPGAFIPCGALRKYFDWPYHILRREERDPGDYHSPRRSQVWPAHILKRGRERSSAHSMNALSSDQGCRISRHPLNSLPLCRGHESLRNSSSINDM